MCHQCEQLSKKIGQDSQIQNSSTADRELDLYILEIFEAASRFLETSGSGGNIRQNLGRATDNLIKMYELDAPECLIRKAHSVQRMGLRNLRASVRCDLQKDPRQRRRELIVIRGGRS
jgi:hypothetical protein